MGKKAKLEDQEIVTRNVEVSDAEVLLRLSGPNSAHLRTIAKEFGVASGLRGNTIHMRGRESVVAGMERVLAELIEVLEGGKKLSENEIARATRTLRDHPEVRLRDLFDDVILTTAQRRIISPKGVAQQRYIQSIREHDVVFGIGPAGTGKTYLAMAMAVRALTARKVKRIILTRPAVEAGERLGFLPGDLADKVNPYLRPLYDALHDMMEDDQVAMLIQRGTIEVAPLAFMRGRTLSSAFVVLDEAQNTTPAQMKMFLTRIGFDSKAVITGDVTQTDLGRGQRSGLADAQSLLGGIEGIDFCRFSEKDVVRHPLVQRIVLAYDRRSEKRKSERQRSSRPETRHAQSREEE